MTVDKVHPNGDAEGHVAEKQPPKHLYIALGVSCLVSLGLLIGVIVLAASGSDSPLTAGMDFASTGPPMQVENPCAGTKPTSGYDNKDCFIGQSINAVEQAGGNITKGYVGEFNTSAVPILNQYYETGLCPVNVHWHLGSEHLSAGQFDETGTGPTEIHTRRRAAGMVRQGFQCTHYDAHVASHTKPYDWKYCDTTMEVGQTYEVHWPHSKGGMCGTIHQYQTPFYDGVFCVASRLVPTTQDAIGVQGQIFMIVNDEDYYYPDLIRGMIIDDTHGIDIAVYTGSTTGTSRDNTICSAYAPITWQVDRTCHPISASSFDKMCADMKAQHDDMSADLHAHGARELVSDALVADNQQDLPVQFP